MFVSSQNKIFVIHISLVDELNGKFQKLVDKKIVTQKLNRVTNLSNTDSSATRVVELEPFLTRKTSVFLKTTNTLLLFKVQSKNIY